MTTVATTASSVSTRTILTRSAWFAGWLFLTVFVWFEVVKHGYVNGGRLDAVVLTATAVGAFVLPDLTFLVGLGEEARQGYLPRRAVPFYNALHRFWPPLLLTTVVVIVFDPLGPVALVVFIAGLSWMAHVAMDRAAGYGLRNADGGR